MYILIDIEWIRKDADIKHITQIAASRVNDKWECTDWFSCLVCPDDQICEWRHVAYNGYYPVEFLDACTERECVKQFLEFIEDDDTLCVWSRDSKDILCEKYRLYKGKELSNECICVSQRVRSVVRKRGIKASGMYPIARALGIKTPKPMHCSVNDISVFGAILSSVDIEQEGEFVEEELQKEEPQVTQAPQPSPTLEKAISKKERNAEILKKVPYNFVFTPNSPVFHRPSCKVMLRANDILGSVYYKTVIKKRRPCKLCFPDPIEDGKIFEERIPQPKTPTQKETPQKAPKQKPQDKIVTVKLLGNNRAHVPKSKLVGCCHYFLHPGKLTEEIMMRHKCIKKKCKYFEKYENSPYWSGGNKTPVEDNESKQERKTREQRARQIEDSLEEKRALFQSYADALEHEMFIVSVERLSKRHYMAYYVSENSFADEDKFLDLLDTISYFFPKRWIEIQHMQDETGYFVTIDEYMSRNRK